MQYNNTSNAPHCGTKSEISTEIKTEAKLRVIDLCVKINEIHYNLSYLMSIYRLPWQIIPRNFPGYVAVPYPNNTYVAPHSLNNSMNNLTNSQSAAKPTDTHLSASNIPVGSINRMKPSGKRSNINKKYKSDAANILSNMKNDQGKRSLYSNRLVKRKKID